MGKKIIKDTMLGINKKQNQETERRIGFSSGHCISVESGLGSQLVCD